uniref:Putative secreted protein n=1 Tax=Anopheles darlingi TaxID=43151 RepID=A0A2M4DB67_ANODA
MPSRALALMLLLLLHHDVPNDALRATERCCHGLFVIRKHSPKTFPSKRGSRERSSQGRERMANKQCDSQDLRRRRRLRQHLPPSASRIVVASSSSSSSSYEECGNVL